jgi:anti-sigma-K factor RskA
MTSAHRTPRPSEFRLLSPSRFSPALAGIAAAVLVTVGTATWFAGVQYGRLRNQQAVSDLTDAQKSATKLRVELNKQQDTNRTLEDALKTSGTDKAAQQMEAMRTQILRLQAQVDQFKSSTDLDRQLLNDNAQLVTALATPGLRLMPLHGQESAAKSVGYALIAAGKEVIVVVSSLPDPGSGHDYQLWITRKEDPKLISGGVFSPDDSNRALVRFSEADLTSEIVSLEVTEEPLGGSDAPSGPKVFISEPKEE